MQEGTDKKMDPEQMLKGRMAETLVEELLKKSGNTLYRFGYEAIMQNLVQLNAIFDARNEAGKQIRSIPDFILLDDKGEPFFVEVKFRYDGKVHWGGHDRILLERIQKYWNAKIIFVNNSHKPYFQVSSAPYLNERGELVCIPLTEEKSWKIDPPVYAEFETLVEKYLTPPFKK